MTNIPVLVEAFPIEKREGRIIQSKDYDIPVRSVPLRALGIFEKKSSIAKLEREYGTVPESARLGLIALVELAQAIHARDIKSLSRYAQLKAVDETKKEELNLKSLMPEAFTLENKQARFAKKKSVVLRRVRTPMVEFGREIDERTRGARFVLWWNEGEERFEPGVYCENMATALAVLIFSRISSPRTLAVCPRQNCGRRFVRIKQNQQYCSLRCGNAARKARQRARQKKG